MTTRIIHLEDTSIRRLTACFNVLDGIGTEALEKISKLSPRCRFGALSDLAKLHQIKAEGER